MLLVAVRSRRWKRPAREQKRKTKWSSGSRQEHLCNRLQKAIERKATLLHEEELVTLRSLHQSLDMTGIGVRLLWEHRNENKWEIVGRFLACFRSPLP